MTVTISDGGFYSTCGVMLSIFVTESPKPTVSLHTTGSDWDRALRAYEAARPLLAHGAVVEVDSDPKREEIRQSCNQDDSEPSTLARLGRWANDNQGVVALIGLAVAVVLGVLGVALT